MTTHRNPRAAEGSLWTAFVEELSSSTATRAKALFFLAAGLSFVMSVSLFFSGDRERGIFVGLWVPSILSAGALLLGGSDDD